MRFPRIFFTFMPRERQIEYLMGKLIPRGFKTTEIVLRDREEDGRDIPVKKIVSIPMRVDYRKAIHLYPSEEVRAFIWRLKPSTLRLLYYIMENASHTTEDITINCNIASRALEMHYTTVYHARNELEKDRWIKRTDLRDIYKINLTRFSREGVTAILAKYDREEEREIRQKELDEIIARREEKRELSDDY